MKNLLGMKSDYMDITFPPCFSISKNPKIQAASYYDGTKLKSSLLDSQDRNQTSKEEEKKGEKRQKKRKPYKSI